MRPDTRSANSPRCQRPAEGTLPENFVQLARPPAVNGWKTGQAPISLLAHTTDNEVPRTAGENARPALARAARACSLAGSSAGDVAPRLRLVESFVALIYNRFVPVRHGRTRLIGTGVRQRFGKEADGGKAASSREGGTLARSGPGCAGTRSLCLLLQLHST